MSTVRVQFHAVDIRAKGFETEDDSDYFDGAVDFDIAVGGAVRRGLVVRQRVELSCRVADLIGLVAARLPVTIHA